MKSISPRLPALLSALVAVGLIAHPVLAQEPAANSPQGKGAAVKSGTPVTLNFVNADIEAVTRAMGVMMNKQFMLDPRVKGTITLYSEQPLSVSQAYVNYLAALRSLGFTVAESAGLLKVLPENEAKYQGTPVVIDTGTPRGDQVLTQVYKLNYEQANNLVAVLRPMISPNNLIQANSGNNTLVITDYADNLQRIAKVIAAMDTPSATDVEIVPIKHGVASELAALVLRLSDGGSTAAQVVVPGQQAPGGGSSGGVSVLADPRSNSLILRAPNAARLASLRALVAKLDVPSGDASGNIRVVYLKNADAVKLATVLRAAFASAMGNSSAGSSGTSGNTQTSFGLNTQGGAGNPGTNQTLGANGTGSVQSAASTNPVAASPSPSTGGFVQADPSTNSLIITAPEPLYRQIRNVIEQLDGRRAQIYVESMIVKIDATKSGQFGVQWQNFFGGTGSTSITGLGTNFGTTGNIVNNSLAVLGAVGSGTTSSTTTSALSNVSVPNGFNVGVASKVGNYWTLGAIANFLQSEVGGNVLSTPNLIALDNEEAKIVVGSNVPFITGTYTNTGGVNSTANPFQTIQRQDVGLTLRIRSQVGEGGTVRMTVYQENSSVTSTNASSGPTTDKSAIETTVAVDDGGIIVLGGLLKDEYTDGEDSVPVLGDIPVVGNLFKSSTRKRQKTNLLVFLRPVVVRDQAGADQLSLDRYEAIRALQVDKQPKSKTALPDTGAPVLPMLDDKRTPPAASSAPVKP